MCLEPVFSLVGHASPSEITCFSPFSFKKILKYYVLVVASQDLSLSFWNTLNPKPFLLLKNFTESPILDMFWDGLTLYVSSYDGVVKKIEFEEKEFGTKIESDECDQEFELPFNERNIEMQKNYEKRIEKLDFSENIELVKLEGFTVDGISLEDFMRNSIDLEEHKQNLTRNEDKAGISTILKDSNNGTVQSQSSINKSHKVDNNGISNNNAIQVLANGNSDNKNPIQLSSNDNVQSHSNINSGTVQPQSNNNIEVNQNITVPIQSNANQSKPKRINPIMIDKPKSTSIHSKRENSTVVLYDTNQPDKLRLFKTKPFKTVLNDFTIKLDDDGAVHVFRATRHFYSINGPCNKVCFNDDYLAIYTTHLQIYELETGCLVLPFLFIRLSHLDILDSKILVLDVYGDFTIFNLKKNTSVKGKLAKTKDLTKIQLSRTHFLVAEYSDSEIVFYNRKIGVWLSINPGFNSITTNGIDFMNDNDDTMAELELSFVHYHLIGDSKNTMAVLKQFICLIKRMRKIEEYVEYKLEKMLSNVNNPKTLELLLEEMNREIFLQKFVFKMARKFGIKGRNSD